MNPEEEIVCLLMNYINRDSKTVQAKSNLKEKFILYLEKDCKMKIKLNESDKLVAELNKENEQLLLNTSEVVKLIEEREIELEKLIEENKLLSKQLKKRQTVWNCIDFKHTSDDLNVFSKKLLKLSNLKGITKLFIDNAGPKHMHRGFSVNLEQIEIDCFEMTKDDQPNIWDHVKHTSEYMDEWQKIFEL